MLASQIIYVNRRKYAVGLFWQPVGAGFAPRNYARSLAHNIDKKLNLYTEYRAMIGLGARRYGQRVGMISAAAEVMESFSEYTSFLAVFQLNKMFFLVAARNGVILEDKIFYSEDEARNEYMKLSEIPDWGAFFAPGVWGMPRAAERNLADLLTGRSHAVLHSISRFGTGMISVGLIVIFVLGLGVVFKDSVKQVMQPKQKIEGLNPELVAEYHKQIEQKNKELDEQFEIEKVAPPEPIVMPFEILPDRIERAKVCYQAMGFLMQPIPGWNQVWVRCSENGAVAELKRTFGTLGDFYAVANDLMAGAFVQELDENTVRVSANLPVIDVVASQDERDAETIVRDITTLFQEIDTDVVTQIVVDTLTNGVDVEKINLVEVEVNSKLVPMQFMKIFEEFGGVYMVQCAWDVRSRMWNYEVIIYAK